MMKYKKMLLFAVAFTMIVAMGSIMGCANSPQKMEERTWSYLAAVQNEDGKWGYINEKFEEIIPCQFESAEEFEPEGVAIVEIQTETGENKFTVIDLQGNIIASNYDEITRVGQRGKEALFLVGEEEIDENGNEAIKFGYMNQEGEEIIECIYDLFQDPLCNYGGLGLVDPSSDFLSNLVGDVCVVSKNKNGKIQFGVMDAQGKIIIPFGKYDYIYMGNYNNKLVVGEYIGLDADGEDVFKFGCIDIYGNQIVPMEYDKLYWEYRGESLLVGEKHYDNAEDKYYYFDEYGKVIFSADNNNGYKGYRNDWSGELRFFEKRLTQVWNLSGEWGFMSIDGKMEVPFGTVEVKGMVLAAKEESFIIMGENYQWRSGDDCRIMSYDGEIIGRIDDVEYAQYVGDNLVMVSYPSTSNDYYLFDLKGNMVLEEALVTSSTPYHVCENGWIALREAESEKIFYYDVDKQQKIELPDKYQMSIPIFVEIKAS